VRPLELHVVTHPSPPELARRLPRLLAGIGAPAGGVALLVQARPGLDVPRPGVAPDPAVRGAA